MGRTTLASQIDDDSELLERFQEFEEETGYGNRSKALRAALRRGLDDYEGDTDEQQSRAESLADGASEAALTAVGLYTVSALLSLPVVAELLLSGATVIFAGAGVVGYAAQAREKVGTLKLPFRVGASAVDDLDAESDTSSAAMSSIVRTLGGGLTLLALLWVLVSGVL